MDFSLAQPDPDWNQKIDKAIGDAWTWVTELLEPFQPYALWIFIFLLSGGWVFIIAPISYALRRIRTFRRSRKEIRRSAVHAQVCRCGERCDSVDECEGHHVDCNCDHDSFCVCQDIKKCDCECRCDCRECEGYVLTDKPLKRIPHGALPVPSPVTGAGDDEPQPSPARASPGSPADNVKALSWTKARKRFLEMSEEYASYECDPYELARLPALADVTFDTTATFIEAFYHANQLLTATKPGDPKDASRFVAAAERAVRAWEAAKEAAELVLDTRLDDDEKVMLRRIRRSLKLADNAADPDERAHALDTAARLMCQMADRAEGSGRWRLPQKARLELTGWTRRDLTASSDADADGDVGRPGGR